MARRRKKGLGFVGTKNRDGGFSCCSSEQQFFDRLDPRMTELRFFENSLDHSLHHGKCDSALGNLRAIIDSASAIDNLASIGSSCFWDNRDSVGASNALLDLSYYSKRSKDLAYKKFNSVCMVSARKGR